MKSLVCIGKRNGLLFAGIFGIAVYGAGLKAQVPVTDITNLQKSIQQLEAMREDAQRQANQIIELRNQVRLLGDQLTSLDGILDALNSLNDIEGLFNSEEDIISRSAKIADIGGFTQSLSRGDVQSAIGHLAGNSATMGSYVAAEKLERTLETAGFTPNVLKGLAESDNEADATIAQTAASNATAIASAEIAYVEAEESIERVNGLVSEISNQTTLKDSIDLQTRMLAENNFMLGSMFRLNAAQGLAQAQGGMSLAAEQTKDRLFFQFNTDGETE